MWLNVLCVMNRPFELAYKRLGDDIIEAFGLDIDEFLEYTLGKYGK